MHRRVSTQWHPNRVQGLRLSQDHQGFHVGGGVGNVGHQHMLLIASRCTPHRCQGGDFLKVGGAPVFFLVPWVFCVPHIRYMHAATHDILYCILYVVIGIYCYSNCIRCIPSVYDAFQVYTMHSNCIRYMHDTAAHGLLYTQSNTRSIVYPIKYRVMVQAHFVFMVLALLMKTL